MLLAAVSLSVAASSPVCDFRLTLQSDGQKKYTNGSSVYTTNATFYESLGLKTRAATCVNLVILDLEHPAEAHPRHWWAHSDALLRGIANATARRIKIVRDSLPHAKL